jgi:putative flippase GtrA
MLGRGAVVGIAATIGDVLALVLLVTVGLPPALASFPALAIGVAIQFVGSKLFTFEDRSRAWAQQGALFLLVEAAALGLNLALFDVGLRLSHLPYPLVRLATTSVVYAGFSLPLWSLVFRRRAA